MPTDYDAFAEAYSRENESSLLNAFYERPAMIALLGDVYGNRVLDAGCGSGPLMAALRTRGAIVSGFDSSAAMIDLARRRLGEGSDLRVSDLQQPLPFSDSSFDSVAASLSLHYVEDWVSALRELRRVLKTLGRLVLSVPHPSVYLLNYGGSRYFTIHQYSETFEFSGQQGTLTYWHRPLHAMTDAFSEAGFRILTIREPSISIDTPRELLPPDFGDRRAFVCFLFFVLEA